MRILVVGAGAIGGYFGGRMLQAGRDVTLPGPPETRVRAGSAQASSIKSPTGDVTLKNPPTVQADRLNEEFDVVLLSCKAFDLDDAIKSFAPAGRARTRRSSRCSTACCISTCSTAKFGAERVLGGLCAIAVTLNEAREVVQLGADAVAQFRRTRRQDVGSRPRHRGSLRAAATSARRPARHVMQDMWEKWVFLASLAASTCLMRTSVGNILAVPGGKDFLLGMLDECSAIAAAEGYAPGGPFFQRARGMLTAEGSADDRLDVPRHQGRPAGGSRSRDRRSRRARATLRKFRCQNAHRLHASQGLREAAG